jgi:hypothetical protein
MMPFWVGRSNLYPRGAGGPAAAPVGARGVSGTSISRAVNCGKLLLASLNERRLSMPRAGRRASVSKLTARRRPVGTGNAFLGQPRSGYQPIGRSTQGGKSVSGAFHSPAGGKSESTRGQLSVPDTFSGRCGNGLGVGEMLLRSREIAVNRGCVAQ